MKKIIIRSSYLLVTALLVSTGLQAQLASEKPSEADRIIKERAAQAKEAKMETIAAKLSSGTAATVPSATPIVAEPAAPAELPSAGNATPPKPVNGASAEKAEKARNSQEEKPVTAAPAAPKTDK